MDTKEIRGFIDKEGRVTSMPAKRRKQLMVITYIAERLPLIAGETKNEREINGMLNQLITYGDPVTLRRDLVDLGYLSRTSDGKEYRVSDNPPELDNLLASCI